MNFKVKLFFGQNIWTTKYSNDQIFHMPPDMTRLYTFSFRDGNNHFWQGQFKVGQCYLLCLVTKRLLHKHIVISDSLPLMLL